MLFNSLPFLFFLPVVFTLYWFVFNQRTILQNLVLLIASYFFYACWDWRFLFLLIFSTGLDFYLGNRIHTEPDKSTKKRLLAISIISNLGILGVFKYYNFFIENFISAFASIGININPSLIHILLPVGISFYTFHGLSYIFDIYKDRCKPAKNLVSYSVFVCYFPLLVAGPIERATHLLPQIENARKFNYNQSINGMRLMIWGFFKKIAVADSLAPIVDDIFKNHHNYPGLILITGAIFFSIQIYADFSGYTDIARGVSKIFGIELLLNFNLPYFSKSIPEFWKRWHISLSSWFRDYLYIPLGGSRAGMTKAIRNIFIIFLLSGFWHGANWTFIIWGSFHAVLYIPFFLRGTNKPELENESPKSLAPGFNKIPEILLTFSLVSFAWIFFRSDSLNQAMHYISGLTRNIEHKQYLNPYNNHSLNREFFLIIFLIILEFFIYNRKYFNSFWERPLASAVLLAVLIFLILTSFQLNGNHAFIYFQF